MKKGWIKVQASPVSGMGDVELAPISETACLAYEMHMMEMTGSASCEAFVPDSRIEHDLKPYMPAQKYRDLQNGWDVVFLMDPWVFGHFLGWDAHEVTW